MIKNSYHSLDERLYTKLSPTPLENPVAGHFNHALATKLGLNETYWQENWVDILAGKTLPEGYNPLAMAYAGHQFGVWAGQLGDGRGLLLSQIEKEGTLWDLHLKGAGKTPYSRMGDGRAVLRSTIREYLAGHALNSLGIKSSDGLGFISSSTPVRRETMETGATMIRVADTHIRLGHFEWINAYAPDLLTEFTDYVVQTYYPHTENQPNPILAFAEEVIKNTAKMIADWQLVGFAHGVMNTDNLSITGSTLDFGPFGFMQRFEPAWINNHSDHHGRYTYQNQPGIAHWNLMVWLGQLLPLQKDHTYIDKQSLANVLDTFEPTFLAHFKSGMAKKVGLQNTEAGFAWAMKWLQLMEDEKLDYTNTFRALIHHDVPEVFGNVRKDIDDMDNVALFDNLMDQYQTLLTTHSLEDRQKIMSANNPIYILRNDMAQKAIEQAEKGDMSEVDRLFTLLSQPFIKQSIATYEDTIVPDKHAEQLIVSCSS